MTRNDILREVFAGRKLTLSFPSQEARESFRQKLYKGKAVEDKVLTDILDEEKKVMRFEIVDKTIVEGNEIVEIKCEAKIWLEKKPMDQYSVIQIIDPEENGKDQIVPGSLGKDSQ